LEFNTEGAESAEDAEKKMMAYENILYEKKDGIAYITFNRPKVLNALNRKTVEELQGALLDARGDESVRVLILTGTGEKSFVAGADISELAVQTPVNGKEFSLYGQSVFHLLETMGKPSICAINGFALGGGCELALSCTIRIASRTAKLGQPEVKLGILPGYGGTQRLARLCGKGAAHELCLTGEMITAEEALRIGLVNHVYQPAELIPAAEAMARKIIANGPLAVKFTMEAIERGTEAPLEEGLFLEATLFGVACATEDMREGTKAFLEKRSPQFKGK
jgi:enoyl-CoA hydratase